MDWDLKLRENIKEKNIFSEEKLIYLDFGGSKWIFFLLKIGI